MRLQGASEAEIHAALGDDEEGHYQVWAENVDTIETFLALQTQWRLGPMGGYLGLDYPGVQAALGMRGVRKPADRRRMFDDLQAMERAALAVLNAKR